MAYSMNVIQVTFWHISVNVKYGCKCSITNITNKISLKKQKRILLLWKNLTAAVGMHWCLWFRGQGGGDLFRLLCLHLSIIKCLLKCHFGSAASLLQFRGEQFGFYKWIVFFKDNHLCSTNAFSLDWCMRQQSEFIHMHPYTQGTGTVLLNKHFYCIDVYRIIKWQKPWHQFFLFWGIPQGNVS